MSMQNLSFPPAAYLAASFLTRRARKEAAKKKIREMRESHMKTHAFISTNSLRTTYIAPLPY
jgi:hypothetical protein